MEYHPCCILSVIFSSVCMGTIWQMPLIVTFLVPEGRYCYPQILFLWIKKPQCIQYFPIVNLWSNSWIILFFLGPSPVLSHPSSEVEAKNAKAKSRGGIPRWHFCILISQLSPDHLHSRRASGSFHLQPIVVPVGIYSLFFFFSGHWPSCICGFSLFWLQSNILYLKPIKQHPLILWFVEFNLLDKLDCGILASLPKSS